MMDSSTIGAGVGTIEKLWRQTRFAYVKFQTKLFLTTSFVLANNIHIISPAAILIRFQYRYRNLRFTFEILHDRGHVQLLSRKR